MSRKRTVIITLAVFGALASVAVAIILTPPANWRQIRIGMPRAEVERLVPFDFSLPERNYGMTYDEGSFSTWGLSVTWKEGKTVGIHKELWIHYPREAPTMIWSYTDKKK